MEFKSFNLDPSVEAGVAVAGFVTPTPIQTEAIPSVMNGRDILGLAQTGTGKTAVFALPILHRLMKGKRGHVRQQHQHSLTLKCERFAHGQRHVRHQQPLDDGVGGLIDEHDGAREYAGVFESLAEQEKGHYDLLTAEKNALTGGFYWFDMDQSGFVED